MTWIIPAAGATVLYLYAVSQGKQKATTPSELPGEDSRMRAEEAPVEVMLDAWLIQLEDHRLQSSIVRLREEATYRGYRFTPSGLNLMKKYVDDWDAASNESRRTGVHPMPPFDTTSNWGEALVQAMGLSDPTNSPYVKQNISGIGHRSWRPHRHKRRGRRPSHVWPGRAHNHGRKRHTHTYSKAHSHGEEGTTHRPERPFGLAGNGQLGATKTTRRRIRTVNGLHGMKAWYKDSMVEKLNARTNEAIRQETIERMQVTAQVDVNKPMEVIDVPKTTMSVPQKPMLVQQMKQQIVMKPSSSAPTPIPGPPASQPAMTKTMVKLQAADFHHSDSQTHSLGSAFVKTRGVMGRLLGP